MRQTNQMSRRWDGRALAALVGLMILGVASQLAFSEPSARESRESAIDTKELERKLDHVLKNQQTILQQLQAMEEELRIIKIRVSIND